MGQSGSKKSRETKVKTKPNKTKSKDTKNEPEPPSTSESQPVNSNMKRLNSSPSNLLAQAASDPSYFGQKSGAWTAERDVSLDPVDKAPATASKASGAKIVVAASAKETLTSSEASAASEASEASDVVAELPKRKMGANVAQRLSMVESIISGADVVQSEASLSTAIQRIEDNDPTLTELVLNNIVYFGKASKEERVLKEIQLADAVQNNTCLLSLSLTNNMLDDAFAVAIAQALSQNKTLASLNVESNHITGVGVQALANMLTTNTTLRELKLANQKFPISSEGEEALSSAMEVNETLIKLNLDIRDATQREWIEKRLSGNFDRLRKQRFEENRATAVVQLTELQRKIMSIVTDNYDSTDLDLSADMEFTSLKEEEKVALASALANNSRIKLLKLVKVQLRDAFAEALGASLAVNKVLEIISLESNSITGSGVVAIAAGLKSNTTLRELRLQGQTAAISTEGEEALCSALEENKTLLKLGLQIRNPTAREKIDKYLQRNNDLKRQQRNRLSMSSDSQ